MPVLRYVLGALLLALIVLIGAGYFMLRMSLPALDGEIATPNVRAPVVLERDQVGTPTIRAQSRVDLAYATGFAHAQDRFFQMDLMRRAAAGELAELLGPSFVDADRQLRTHGFRRLAQVIAQRATPEQRDVLTAYVAGVNGAMLQWRSRPWEYWMLRTEPRPWLLADSVLVAFALYLDLNDASGEVELARTRLRAALPPELFDFLHPIGTEWDAPIDGGTWRPAPIPGPEVFDLQAPSARAMLSERLVLTSLFDASDVQVGSNSWAVAGSLTEHGAAMLANDMHLALRVPNVWYRARLIVEANSQNTLDLVGVTLPGLPMLVAGSNRFVAWGMTNSYGDWTDLVLVDPDPTDADHYLTAEGSRPYEVRTEVIQVKGDDPITLQIRWTRWGPIVREDETGRQLALAWTAHWPEATNINMMNLETARTAKEAMDVANRAGGPVQNFVVADTQGSIGWTVMGQIPLRRGYDPRFVAAWHTPETGWQGWRTPAEYPRTVDPQTARLWTANARTIDADVWLDVLGEGGYSLGSRAAQIRDGLLEVERATEKDLLAVQLDDRALFLSRWRDLLLDLAQDPTSLGGEVYGQARAAAEQWSGRASVDDVGYRVVRAFRAQVQNQVFDSLTAVARNADEKPFTPSTQFEGALWQLVTERPVHLLDPRYATWEQALLDAFNRSVDELIETCETLDRCTWGQHNTLKMQHPISSALPLLSRWIDMPAEPLPGDAHMPRVQGPGFGSSERLVVAPGHEDSGILETPGGASGHPLSPFFRSTHRDWTEGNPQPLLPGRAQHRLTLLPRQ